MLLTLSLSSTACVTRGKYNETADDLKAVRAERNDLRERVNRLEASNESLSSERLGLLDELENLRETREDLERSVRELMRVKEELEISEQQLAESNAELDKLRTTYEEFVGDLESEIAEGQIMIDQLREGLQVNLPDDSFFAPGSVRVNGVGRGVLKKVADQLQQMDHRIEVRGHTDNQPVSGALAQRFPSNWELAGARAASVARLLVEWGIDPQRVRAVSYGEHQPLVPNDSSENRARNRRIEIRLLPTESSLPAAAGGAAPPAHVSAQ